MVVGRLWGRLDDQATLALRGGELSIEWKGEGQPVWMSGPAETVYEGRLQWPG
jgi:diaminopimelate epimerase